MNVIEAGYRLGVAIGEMPEGKELLGDKADDWKSAFGEECWIRLSELVDYAKQQHDFFAWDYALTLLKSLNDPADENDPIRYWTSLRDCVKGNQDLEQYAETMKGLGTRIWEMIAAAFAPAARSEHFEDSIQVQNAFNDLALAIKRSGAIGRIRQSAQQFSTADSIAGLDNYSQEAERTIWARVVSGKRESANEANQMDRGLCEAVDALCFCQALARKSTFWGFEQSMVDLSVSECSPKLEAPHGITRVSFSEDTPTTLFDRTFSAARIVNGELVIGYFLPSRKVMNFTESCIHCEHEGVLYPVRDKGLFAGLPFSELCENT